MRAAWRPWSRGGPCRRRAQYQATEAIVVSPLPCLKRAARANRVTARPDPPGLRHACHCFLGSNLKNAGLNLCQLGCLALSGQAIFLISTRLQPGEACADTQRDGRVARRKPADRCSGATEGRRQPSKGRRSPKTPRRNRSEGRRNPKIGRRNPAAGRRKLKKPRRSRSAGRRRWRIGVLERRQGVADLGTGGAARK